MKMKPAVPKIRIRSANAKDINPQGDFILYWMTACRRVWWNFSLDRAVEWAVELKKPLIILEALRCGYGWASDRFHAFIMAGMADNASAVKGHRVLYYPYLEPAPDEDKGLLETLAKEACIVVTDDFPTFFIPRMIQSAAKKLPVRLEIVDSNGLLPIASTDRIFTTAYSFRRFVQKTLLTHLDACPTPFVFNNQTLTSYPTIPERVKEKWPPLSEDKLIPRAETLQGFPIDHDVPPTGLQGGTLGAQKRMARFLKSGLSRYHEDRNQPDLCVTSGLSPYLHFGHISSHQIFFEIVQKEKWQKERTAQLKANGKREGWWGLSPNAEAFLDQLITWRELGFNMCYHNRDHDHYETLPQWALDTLEKHRKDERPYTYSLDTFEKARTHDPLWNAAQNQLVRDGYIHNYLRMLWGKKILHWTESPRDALNILIHLNNKYAMDGRDPNSYSGIFWVLGRYDRAWGPERPVFGKIRYMRSKNTARKIRTVDYVERYKPDPSGSGNLC